MDSDHDLSDALEFDEDGDFAMTEDETDQFFDPIVPASQIKKSYEIEYTTVSMENIKQKQSEAAEQVSNILGLSFDDCKLLLKLFRWDKEVMIEEYMESSLKYSFKNVVKKQEFDCDICCDSGILQTFEAECGHAFCVGCYSQYVTQKINEAEILIKCPTDCDMFIGYDRLSEILEPNTIDKYEQLIIRAYVDDKKYIKWCPYPDCTEAISCKIPSDQFERIVPSVECAKSHRFCFGCGETDHQPATCKIAKLWLKKCEDDSETSNWINANTKECTKCNSTIEKNGGCNHMTCRKCKYEFCWICLGPWAQHGQSWYNCNRFEESESISARTEQAKSRAALERYLHYYNRYANHDQSARLDKELYEKTEKKMEDMQHRSEFSWIQVQFLKDAVHVLLRSRATLMWTYGFAYYLERNENSTKIFEDNQKDLEMAVEALSGLLEHNITAENAAAIRQQVLDKTEYVNRRREVLLSDTANGHIESRWSYNITQKSTIELVTNNNADE